MINWEIKEAEKLKKQGSVNISLLYIATAFHNDKLRDISPSQFFSSQELDKLRHINSEAIDKIIHIFSIGDRWNYDEYMLVLSIRVNYQLIENYYVFFNMNMFLNEKVKCFDNVFIETLANKSNYKNAYSVSADILKNNLDEISPKTLRDIFFKLGLVIS
jgi:hypothetical protein